MASDEQKQEAVCPHCGSQDSDVGYGLAGGGIGVYSICNGCGKIFNKVMDEAEEQT